MRASLASALCLLFVTLGITSVEASDLILVHARVYPSPGAKPLDDATIAVHDQRISRLAARSKHAAGIPQGATVIDCTGMSVTAGFWNSHVHILPVALLHADEKTASQLTAALQDMFTRWGFTTVFDLGSILSNTTAIRARIASGEILGPRILTVGEPFFPPHGIPSYVSGYLQENHISLPDDLTDAAAVERVRSEVHGGANGIKIFAGSYEGNSILLISSERAKTIVEEAHRLKRPVFVHPSNLAGVGIAIESGANVLAHVTSEDESWDAALVARMRAAHMALIPTLTLFDVEAQKDGATPEVQRRVVDQAIARLRAYQEAGGEVLFGTDVGYMYHFDTGEEYTLMQRAGLSFAQILASLTTNPARRFGYARHSGRIAAGMDADLTVVNGDPAADIAAFAHVKFAVRAGTIIFKAGT